MKIGLFFGFKLQYNCKLLKIDNLGENMSYADKILEISLPILFVQAFYLLGVDRFLMTGLTVYCIFLTIYLPVRKMWALFESSVLNRDFEEKDAVSVNIESLRDSELNRRAG